MFIDVDKLPKFPRQSRPQSLWQRGGYIQKLPSINIFGGVFLDRTSCEWEIQTEETSSLGNVGNFLTGCFLQRSAILLAASIWSGHAGNVERPRHFWWLWWLVVVVCKHCHFHLWQRGKHSCASLLLNNTYFFGSCGLLLYTFLAGGGTHLQFVSLTYAKQKQLHMCGVQLHMCGPSCLWHLSPLSTRDWTNNPIRQPPPTLSFDWFNVSQFICTNRKGWKQKVMLPGKVRIASRAGSKPPSAASSGRGTKHKVMQPASTLPVPKMSKKRIHLVRFSMYGAPSKIQNCS